MCISQIEMEVKRKLGRKMDQDISGIESYAKKWVRWMVKVENCNRKILNTKEGEGGKSLTIYIFRSKI